MIEQEPKLLIVDDIAEYLRSLEMVLRSHFEIRTASTVKEAKDRVQAAKPDVALIDVCLDETINNDKSGFDLVDWLSEKHSEIKVIVISALEEVSLPDEALAHGANAFVRKPVNLQDLKKVLYEVLGRDF